MITYLIYSIVSMGILLLFYHTILEKEKMHHINRGFLVFSLIFSLSIPLIPVGMADSFLPFQNQQGSEIQSFPYSIEGEWSEVGAGGMMPVSVNSGTSLHPFLPIVLIIYMVIVGFLFIRLLRIIYMIQLKADRNQRKLFAGYEIVLLNEKVIPHTFYSTIFINKDEYLKGEIPGEILVHELTHAKQKHTIDVLFVEFLKIIFWFNPLLYYYKKAILLNHEFLADEAVISDGAQVSVYQKLLLKTLVGQPTHGLISQFNYSLTKKRLRMMTQSTSTIRTFFKMAAFLPLFAALALLLGCEPSTTEYSSQDSPVVKELSIEVLKSEILNINGELMNLSEFEGYLSGMSEYPEQINLEVNSNATTGMVVDVQNILRKQGALKINYSTTLKGNDENLDRVTKEYLQAAEKYMGMSIENTDQQLLEEEYEKAEKLYEAIQEIEPENSLSPPPPPFVPSPEKRLEISVNNSDQSNLSQSTPAPPVEKRNLLQILLDAQGSLLMNEEPTKMNDVKNRIKQFVDNNGRKPDLSENSQEAIVSIKTDRNTSHELYIDLLDEVLAAYSELRDKAAQDRFGTTFSSMEENSDQWTEVKEIYPKRISIVPPEGS
ncbi:MAG: M56 family metallopeptidase [Balneolaceae bacterium]